MVLQDAILYLMVGYATFVCFPGARYWFNRQEGWKMFFVTVLVGWVVWHGVNFAGWFITDLFGVPATFAESVPIQLSSTLAALGIVALTADNMSAAKRVATVCGDLTELLLQDAVRPSASKPRTRQRSSASSPDGRADRASAMTP